MLLIPLKYMQNVSTYNPHGYDMLQPITFIIWLTGVTSMYIFFVHESSTTGLYTTERGC